MKDSPNLSIRLKRIRNSKFRAWLSYQVIIPVLAVVMCWPFSALFDVKYAFEKNFLAGDLLLIGALLFVGIAADIHAEDKYALSALESVDKDDRLGRFHDLSMVLALLFGAIFLAIKLSSWRFDFPSNVIKPTGQAAAAQIPLLLYIEVWASIIGGLVSIVWSYWVCKRSFSILLDAEIREHGGTPDEVGSTAK